MTLKISQMTAADALIGSELLEVSQLSTTVTKTATTISALASDNSYNDSGSGFVAAGFAVNDQIAVTGFTGNVANNIFSAKITAVTAGKITIGGTDGDVIVNDAAGESVTITKWITRRTSAGEIVDLITGGSSGFDANSVDYAPSSPSDWSPDPTTVQEALDALAAASFDGGGPAFGKQAIWIAAGSITPSVTGGCATLATIASAANQPDIQTLDFDTTTQEYAQFSIHMPTSWNEGTVTFKPVWSHAATTTNFGVVFNLQAVAVSNDDPIAVAFGTAQTSSDTGGTTNDIYIGPESSAITVSGTPAAGDMVFFRLSRVTGDGGDTMAIDARLHGITLYITTDSAVDS